MGGGGAPRVRELSNEIEVRTRSLERLAREPGREEGQREQAQAGGPCISPTVLEGLGMVALGIVESHALAEVLDSQVELSKEVRARTQRVVDDDERGVIGDP
jgi:hypothetical protein